MGTRFLGNGLGVANFISHRRPELVLRLLVGEVLVVDVLGGLQSIRKVGSQLDGGPTGGALSYERGTPAVLSGLGLGIM